MRVTNEKLLQLDANINLVRSGKKDKLSYAVEEHFIPNLKTALTPYLKKQGKIYLDNALTGKDGEILYEEEVNKDGSKNYKFSREGMAKLREEIEKLGKEEVELEVYVATEFQRAIGFHSSVKELYNGILWEMDLKKISEEEFIKEGEFINN